MVDWLSSMQQTYEYYVVDPGTWKDIKLLDNVKSCSITRDESVETLGSATIDVTETVGECYIRAYLVTIQNGIRERHALGTFLVQTPASNYDGKQRGVSMDAYTPLLELKENPPPLGYSIFKNENIMDNAYRIIRENVRAPIVKPNCDKTLQYDFTANLEDTWLSFNRDLVAAAEYKFAIDEFGYILFSVEQDLAAMQPIWTYNDDNSSILYSDVSMNHDLYGIPNVVEVLYSVGSAYYYGIATNDDPNSPTSTVSRGRTIKKRITDPNITGNPTQEYIQQYAEKLLREVSEVEYTITYTHGYCPVRLGDCVRLNYARAGLNNIKAKVVSQTINCTPGCPVTEKAVFTAKLWEG